MIDKLEVGVKYKLEDVSGYINSHHINEKMINRFLTDEGCFILDTVEHNGNGNIDGYTVIGKKNGEFRFFSKYEYPLETEYRVIRKASKNQVCGWRKGVKLYEDGVGTLVRNDKRTKFYTDIVEWREVEKVTTLEDVVDYLKGMDSSASQASIDGLITKVLEYKKNEKGAK